MDRVGDRPRETRYSRDYVHSAELGKQLIARITLAYFTAVNPKNDMTADAIDIRRR